MFARKTFVMNHTDMPIPDLVLWLHDTATLQEAHPFHGTNWPDWVPGPAGFRDHAVRLDGAFDAAKNRDREKVRELEEKHAAALLSIDMNATYIAMRSKQENNETLLHNVGYILKDHIKRTNAAIQISLTPMVLTVKKGPEPGSIAVKFKKDRGAGLYHLQFCKGHPTGDDSYVDGGLHKGCRVVLKNLDLASWYFFRGRSHGNNETGPWSEPVSIIVT